MLKVLRVIVLPLVGLELNRSAIGGKNVVRDTTFGSSARRAAPHAAASAMIVLFPRSYRRWL
jgi:hypothetical protein